MNTTGKEGYWPIVQGLRPGLNDGEEPTIFKCMVEVCSHECIPILDGEFAELGDRIEGGLLPLIMNGTALWFANKNDLIDGSLVKPGDAIVALTESGFRSNGFTFLRGLLTKMWGGREWVNAVIETPEGKKEVSELIMTPSTLYYPVIRHLLRGNTPVHGLVHITGGGVPGKLK